MTVQIPWLSVGKSHEVPLEIEQVFVSEFFVAVTNAIAPLTKFEIPIVGVKSFVKLSEFEIPRSELETKSTTGCAGSA